MSREVLAVDVDEVLFLYLDRFISYHNEKYGTDLMRDHFFSYDFHGPLGVPIPETIRRVHEAYASCQITDLPIEGSVRALEQLRQRYSLSVITARNPKFESETRDWLDEHFPSVFEDIFLVGHPLDIESARKKAEVCRDIGALALIDDSASHVNDCVGLGLRGVLFGDYPWNRSSKILDGVVRCNNWPAVVDFFDGKAV